MDAAYHLFFIIATDDFTIQNYRFGAVVTQIFPLLAGKAGLSLNNILVIYSVGVAFYYSACYYICGAVLKRYALALVILLLNLLFVTHTFFWMHSELPQGCAMLIVTFAIITTNPKRHFTWLKYLLITGLLVVDAFFHPLIIFPAFFLFLYFILSVDKRRTKAELIVFGIIYLLAYFIKFQFYKTSYDNGALDSVTSLFTLLPDFFNLYATKEFIADIKTKFYWIPIFFLAAVWVYSYTKQWTKLLLYVVAFISFIIVINVSYHYEAVPRFYIENLYLPASLILAVPFIFDIVHKKLSYKYSIIILSLIIITAVARIIYISNFYVDRLNWERDYLSQNINEKLIVHERHAPIDTLIFSWGTSYEFWLLSTIEYQQSASLVITDNIDDLIPPPGKTKSYIMRFHGFPYEILPKQYFIFDDTITEYKVIR